MGGIRQLMAIQPIYTPGDRARNQIRDQAAHVVACVVVLSPMLFVGGWFGFALSGLLVGLVREVTEEGNPVNAQRIWRALRSSPLDLAGWTLGGFLLWAFEPAMRTAIAHFVEGA